jgi:hypothetical protein
MKVKERILKVEEHYSEREYSEVITSRIRLKGLWLECAGFKPGDKAIITELSHGRLLIERKE